ncbi:UNVERIFIED_CONTAM: hypothetical protein FKN15_064343 [Acipenser sinensis]
MGTEYSSPLTEPSETLGAPVPPLLQLSQSPSQGIPCAQAQPPPSRSHSPSPHMAKRVKCSRQARDIMDQKAQMAQVLELLARQQTPAAPAMALPAPIPEPAPISPRGAQSELESPARMAEKEDAFSIAASWNKDSFPTEMEEGEGPVLSTEAEPSSEWLNHAGPCSGRRLRLPALSPSQHSRISWRKYAPPGIVRLSTQCDEASSSARFLRRHGQAGSGGFSPSGLHHCGLGQGFAGRGLAQGPCVPKPTMQGHRDALMGLCSGSTDDPPSKYCEYPDRLQYMDGILQEAPLPEQVASELHLLSGTLLQISGLQRQALGRSLANLVVARKLLWLSQARRSCSTPTENARHLGKWLRYSVPVLWHGTGQATDNLARHA